MRLILSPTRGQRYYIQFVLSLIDSYKLEMGQKGLNLIPDIFKKIIITGDRLKLRRTDMGILALNLFDFLLNPNAIDS